jgi:hypothetical protein
MLATMVPYAVSSETADGASFMRTRWCRCVAVEVYTRLLREVHIPTRTLERVVAPRVEGGVNTYVREDANSSDHANPQKREHNDE